MGLPLALQAHQRGDLVQAKQHYQRAFEQQVHAAVLYQNYGALLREQGDLTGAAQVYNQGLALFPHHPGILGNRANLHRATRPAAALADNLRALRLLLAEPAGGSGLRTVWLSTLSQLRELQLHAWALALAREGLARLGPDPQLLLQLLL